MRLPAIPEPEPAGQREARPLPAPRPARQARVLIVEDNDDARVSLQRILQADGHLVSAARDARAGLEAAQAGSPNVAVVDIGLPGMDGYQFARAMRERLGSGIRLIALTGYGTSADRKRSAEAGFDAHLTKPVDLDRLLALITEARCLGVVRVAHDDGFLAVGPGRDQVDRHAAKLLDALRGRRAPPCGRLVVGASRRPCSPASPGSSS